MTDSVRQAIGAATGSKMPRIALGTFAVLLGLTAIIGLGQMVYAWIGSVPPAAIASIDVWKLGMVVGTAGTSATLLITLYIAERDYFRSRKHIPNLSLELRIERISVSPSYDAIVLILKAENTGTGLCAIREVSWELDALSPYEDEDVEEMLEEYDNPEDDEDFLFPWRTLGEEIVPDAIQIEPGERQLITHDFIIPSVVSAVTASAWIENVQDADFGWHSRGVHIQEG